MVKQKTSYRFVVVFISLLIFSLFAALPSQAVQPTAETKEIKSVIEGMRVRQLGGDQILLEIRGSKMPLPKAVRTTPRMTALSPGQSPPPVKTPIV